MINLEEIKEMQEKLNKMIEDYDNQSQKNDTINVVDKWDKNWKADENEDYYFITIDGEVKTYKNDSNIDDIIINRSRVFQTRELAEKWLEIDNYIRAKAFEPNWDDDNQSKYYICYSYYSHQFKIDIEYRSYIFQKYYFENIEIVEEILDRYSEIELKFYFNI